MSYLTTIQTLETPLGHLFPWRCRNYTTEQENHTM